jgi:hypothetical protein
MLITSETDRDKTATVNLKRPRPKAVFSAGFGQRPALGQHGGPPG